MPRNTPHRARLDAHESKRRPRLVGSARRVALAVAVVAGVTLLVAWAVLNGSGEQAAPTAQDPRQRPEVFDFSVTLTDGEPFRLSAYGGRVVVLEFLAPGCPSCAAELAVLSRVAEGIKNRDVVVLVLDVGGLPPDEVAGYYQSQGGSSDFRYALDDGLQVADRYQVQFLGTTIVLDRDGREAYRDGQGTREADLVSAITDAS